MSKRHFKRTINESIGLFQKLSTHHFTSKCPHNINFFILTPGRHWIYLPCKSALSFLKILVIQNLFYKLLNQYQACLYLFECTSHGDSKCSDEIHKFWHFFNNFCDILNKSSALISKAGGKLKKCTGIWSKMLSIMWIFLKNVQKYL